jgi:methylated-DNA-[protein]-cysteine S-methyltransferase
MFVYTQNTKIGPISIVEEDGSITHVCFETDRLPERVYERNTALIQNAFEQLDAYLAGQLRTFNLPLLPKGDWFRQKVWDAVSQCKFGVTVSYKDIACQIGYPRVLRATGAAIRRNPIPIFIPCHRVIKNNGAISGYRGGVELKVRLLALEQNHNLAGRICATNKSSR